MIHGATVLIDPADKVRGRKEADPEQCGRPSRSVSLTEQQEEERGCSHRCGGDGVSAAPSPPSSGTLGARGHISTMLPTGCWTRVGGASVLHLIMYRKHLKN